VVVVMMMMMMMMMIMTMMIDDDDGGEDEEGLTNQDACRRPSPHTSPQTIDPRSSGIPAVSRRFVAMAALPGPPFRRGAASGHHRAGGHRVAQPASVPLPELRLPGGHRGLVSAPHDDDNEEEEKEDEDDDDDENLVDEARGLREFPVLCQVRGWPGDVAHVRGHLPRRLLGRLLPHPLLH
jgi:hypothetical protein